MREYSRSDPQKGATLLWALRSPCNLRCKYCYFGSSENANKEKGHLSHLGDDDISFDEILRFISTFKSNIVSRVFIAGGEPLIFSKIEMIIDALLARGCEVIISTNGLLLENSPLSHRLSKKVDAISISLDSYLSDYNDYWRLDRSGNGWARVVRGISTLVEERDKIQSRLKIGVYTVVTRENIDHIVPTAQFIEKLGVDYFVYQPISIPENHEYFHVLSLQKQHQKTLVEISKTLRKKNLNLQLPNEYYLNLFEKSLDKTETFTLNCFGGRSLFFIQPNGSLWDCPSRHKISATSSLRTIVGKKADEIFRKPFEATTCNLFSDDCVNMWQLMSFDEILK